MFRRSHITRAALVAASFVLSTSALVAAPATASDPRLVVASAGAIPRNDTIVNTVISTSFDLELTQQHASTLATYIASLGDTASTNYHHFLTPTQYAKEFGASAATVDAVRAYFRGFDLKVRGLSTSHVLLHVTGLTSNIARAFDTPVETVHTSGGLVAQFAKNATLPSTIANNVQAVAGLSSVVTPSAQLATSHAEAHVTLPSSCTSAGTSSSTPNSLGGYPATEQALAYGLSAEYANGDTGAGQTIAAYELGLYDEADVATYFTCYGISPTVTPINVDGGPTGAYSEEATIDVEEAAVLAPGATIEVYQGPDSGSSPLDIYQQIADDDTATIVTTSWGICETDPTGTPDAEQSIFEQMAAQGQTVIAASGDSGSSDCADNPDGYTPTTLAVDDPASQPFVTGVGGLTVSNFSPLSETVWNGGVSGGSGGGGESVLWSRPTWQSGSGITASDTMRMVPDVSLMADPNTGFIEYYSGTSTGVVRCRRVCASGWDSIGGTSIAAPLLSSIVAVAAQACGTTRLGFINPTLYQMASEGVGFNDVTTGANNIYNVAGYSAGVGYDMASGLGSPNGAAFIAGLCPPKLDAAKSSFAVAMSSTTVNANATVNVALKDANGNPVANASLLVTASAASGTILINAESSSSTGAGQSSANVTSNTTGAANFTITTNTAGPVSVILSYEGTTLHTFTLNFSASHTTSLPTRPRIASLVALAGGFRLSVAASTNNVTSYQYSVNGGATWISFSAVTRSVTVSNLLKSHTYVVYVRARNVAGIGPASIPQRFTTLK